MSVGRSPVRDVVMGFMGSLLKGCYKLCTMSFGRGSYEPGLMFYCLATLTAFSQRDINRTHATALNTIYGNLDIL